MANVQKCRSCGKSIIFLPSGKGKNGLTKFMPIDADTVDPVDAEYNPKIHKSHFATCPQANEWRRKK